MPKKLLKQKIVKLHKNTMASANVRRINSAVKAGLFISPLISTFFSPSIILAAAMTEDDKCRDKNSVDDFIYQPNPAFTGNEFAIDEKSGLTLPIRLLNWNVQKISNPGWQQDLIDYAQSSNVVLLQEATEHAAIEQHLPHLNFHSLAPGYHDGDKQTGVYTGTQVRPLSSCYQQHKEPWLRTPKAMQVNWYPLNGSPETLLVVNVHSVNFALGIKDYRTQLMAIVDMLQAHHGPIILSGDFNTWNKKRLKMLNNYAADHGLRAIEFFDDQRTQVFGLHLDHVFTRGFTVKKSQTWVTDSSDHNPIYAELELTVLAD